MEAKYYLFSNKGKKKAAEKYEHALILLKEFGESIFINRINLKDFLNS